jgi:hypothetical protein
MGAREASSRSDNVVAAAIVALVAPVWLALAVASLIDGRA